MHYTETPILFAQETLSVLLIRGTMMLLRQPEEREPTVIVALPSQSNSSIPNKVYLFQEKCKNEGSLFVYIL